MRVIDKLTSVVERLAHSLIAVPVIVEAKHGRFHDVLGAIRGFISEGRFGQVIAGVSEIFPWLKTIPSFNYIATILPREWVFDLGDASEVKRVYPNSLKFALGYPVVPDDGIFYYERGAFGEVMPFTTTYYTKRLIGADIAHQKGFMGSGVRVAVVDTGLSRRHPATRHMMVDSVMLQVHDENGHGCIRGATVYTSFCGTQVIEEVWNLIDTEAIQTDNGEFKPFPVDVYTIGYSGVVKVKGMYRTKTDKKVVIETNFGKIEATPWHRFMVIKPRGSWNSGYDIQWKRADEIVPYDPVSATGDCLLVKPYNGESWSLGVDTNAAYLAGLAFGDGIVRYGSINVKTGKVVHGRSDYEIRILDEDKGFLEELSKIYGGKVKDYNPPRLVIYGKKAVEKIIPLLKPPINDLEAMRAWVAGFFDAEGYVSVGRKCAVITQKDKDILEKLATFLTSIGIPAKVYSGGTSKGSKTYQLKVFDTRAFYKFVEPYSIKKKEKLKEIADIHRVHARIVKRVGDWLVIPVRSVEVVDSGDEYFYDLAMSSDKTYIAGGIVSHNSWCSACVGGKYAEDYRLGRLVGRVIPTEGVSPDSIVVGIKCLGYLIGTGSDADILKAIELGVYRYRADIISMSLGGRVEWIRQDDSPYYKPIKELTDYGTIFCVAAGNEGPNEGTIGDPGAVEHCLTVGAYDPVTGEIAEFSSRGPTPDGRIKPDCIAPGVGIHAPTCGLLDRAGDNTAVNNFSPLSGTSMATPHVSGLLALMREAHSKILGRVLTTNEVKQMLAELGEEKNNERGWGLISWDMYERWLSTEYSVDL